MNQDKINLSSVNKEKKKINLPSLKSPFKKSSGPNRNEIGQFATTSGSGGLFNTQHFRWKRSLPLIIVVALVGGFLVFRSFAGTYTGCRVDNVYTQECVTNSDEASVVRLYYGIFNRAPDDSGLKYWSRKLTAKTITLTEVARQFMGSNEFRTKYGSLTNQKFVEAMYPQVFGRQPDSGGLTYWVNRLDKKTVTREAMITTFTQSNEMKRNSMYRVARALGIYPGSYGSLIKTYRPDEVSCFGKVVTDAGTGKKVCQVDFVNSYTNPRTILTAVDLPQSYQSGEYVLCADIKYQPLGTSPAQTGNTLYQVDANSNDRSKLSTDGPIRTYGGLGGGTSLTPDSQSFDTQCVGNPAQYPSSKNIMLSEVAIRPPSGGVVTGRDIVSLENIKLYKTLTQLSPVESQPHDTGTYSEESHASQVYIPDLKSNLPETVTVNGKQLPSVYIRRRYITSSINKQPAWSADFKVEGNVEYTISSYILYDGDVIARSQSQFNPGTLRVKATGKATDGSPVAVKVDLSVWPSGQPVRLGTDTATLSAQNLYEIFIKAEKPATVTLQIENVSGGAVIFGDSLEIERL